MPGPLCPESDWTAHHHPCFKTNTKQKSADISQNIWSNVIIREKTWILNKKTKDIKLLCNNIKTLSEKSKMYLLHKAIYYY